MAQSKRPSTLAIAFGALCAYTIVTAIAFAVIAALLLESAHNAARWLIALLVVNFATLPILGGLLWRHMRDPRRAKANPEGPNQALLASRALLLEAERQAKIASWTQPAGSFTGLTWTENAPDVMGLPAHQLRDMAVTQALVHPDDQARVVALFERVAQSPESYDIQYRYLHPDGSTRWFREIAKVWRDDLGKSLGLIGTIQDITEPKKIEDALRESEARLAASRAVLIEAEQQAKIVSWHQYLGRDERIIWSESAALLLGLPPDTMISDEALLALVHPEDRPRMMALYENALINPGIPDTECRYIHPDGSLRWARFSEKLQLDADGRPWRRIGIIQDITDQKLVELALRDSESRLKESQTLARTTYWYYSPASDSYQWPMEAADILGVASENLPHDDLGFVHFIHPDDRAPIGAIVDNAASSERLVLEFRIICDDGSIRWIREIVHMGTTTGGDVEPVFGTLQDVTSQKQAELALRESEMRLLEAQTLARMTYWYYLPATNSYHWQPEATEILGVAREGLPRNSAEFARFVHPDDRADILPLVSAATLANVLRLEYRIVSDDGTVRWIREVMHMGRLVGGEVEPVFGTLQDVTDQKRAQDSLRQSEARLRETQRRAKLGYWSWHKPTNAFERSAEMADVLGLAPAEVPANERMFLDLVHPDDRPALSDLYARLVEEPFDFSASYRLRRADGETIWIREFGEAQRDRAGAPTGLAGTIQDITELHKLEDQLRQAQKMEAVGQLTGGIAHDFNNLLAIILGNLELAEPLVASNATLSNKIGNAVRATLRSAELTKRLLAFSRRQLLSPASTDVNELITDLKDMLTRPLGPKTDVQFNLADEIWPVEIDRGQLETSLINLVINARDAMPEGGKLTIETATIHIEIGQAPLGDGIAPGEYVRVAISDTGRGMTPEILERVFEPFFTTKGMGQGTGLGLSMVYGFVRQSNGHVRIYSEPGCGTTVSLYLPRAKSGGAKLEAAQTVSAMPRGRNEVVVILEDEPEVAAVAAQYLVELGYRVRVASDGAGALGALEEAPPADLLLSDVVLREARDGPAIAKLAIARQPDLKVLYMSGYAPSANVFGGQLEPGIQLLHKPFRKNELALRVRQALDAQPSSSNSTGMSGASAGGIG